MKKFLLTVILAFIGTYVFAQERIAVFPLEDMNNVFTGNEAFRFYQRFTNEFATRMADRHVVPRQQVERLIGTEMAFQLSEFSAREKTAEMNRVLNGTQILSGYIARDGNNIIEVTVSLYTYPELRQLPGGRTVTAASVDELFNKIPELVQQMQNAIAGSGTEQPIPEGLMYEIVDGRTVTITKYTGTAATLNIPSHIEGLLVTSIGDSAFISEFSNLTSVTIPSSVMSIENMAFFRCYSLISITIPSSVTSIGKSAFLACSSLTSFTVDNRNPAYASIDGVLFDKNVRTLIQYPTGKNQRTYVIPSSVTSIGEYAFSGCSSLTSVSIPSSVTSIGDYAFAYCSSLTSVTIPSSITSIEDRTFSGCNSLTSITIPSSVTSIGESAFSGCSALTSITVDNRNPVYASIDGVLFDKTIQTLIQYPRGRNPGAYVIPSSVTVIGLNAFSWCSNLTSVTIPASVTSIGYGVFENCSSLTSITVDNRNPVCASIDGILFDKTIQTLISYPTGKNQKTYVIPSSVTIIGPKAFYYCESLTSITIPASVTYIGFAAFQGCSSLTSVTIPASVTSIDGYAFYDCRSLTSVTIPASVTVIGPNAFNYCFNLTSVTLSRRTQVGRDAFSESTRITYRD